MEPLGFLFWLAVVTLSLTILAAIELFIGNRSVNAHRINKGEMPLKGEAGELTDFYFIPAETPEEIHAKLLQVVTERIPKRFGMHPVKDVQVLTPMNRGGLGSHSLNAELQKALNPNGEPKVTRFGTTFSPGDKVIQTVNNYDKEVFNGDIGQIDSIDTVEGVISVEYDGRMWSTSLVN